MGGFLGIGTSDQEKALEEQKRMASEEAEQARREAEIAQAEKVAKKGQETAAIKLGGDELVGEEVETTVAPKKSARKISSSLGLGITEKAKGGTGVQI